MEDLKAMTSRPTRSYLPADHKLRSEQLWSLVASHVWKARCPYLSGKKPQNAIPCRMDETVSWLWRAGRVWFIEIFNWTRAAGYHMLRKGVSGCRSWLRCGF